MRRALKWSLGAELLLITPVLVANSLHLGPFDFIFGVLTYLSLYCHEPGFLLIGHWFPTHETLFLTAIVQWIIWFFTLVALFTVAGLFPRRQPAT